MTYRHHHRGPHDAAPRGAPPPLHGPVFARDPQAVYAHLRAHWGPVAPVELEPGINAWLVMGYGELLTVTRNDQLFSRDSRHWRALREGQPPPGSRLLPMTGWRPTLLNLDGGEHHRLRAVVLELLGRVDQRALLDRVTKSADALIDSWLIDGCADLMAQYVRRLTATAFTGLLGLPESSGVRVHSLVSRIADSTDESPRAEAELEALVTELLAERRRTPRSDLATWLLQHPAELTSAELLHQLVIFLAIGLEGTSNWIGNTLRHILCEPRHLAAVLSSRTSVSDALDLALWSDPPLQNLPGRWATEDVSLAGQRIAAGDMLVLGVAAANADPAVQPGPANGAVVSRAHLAWGAGPHSCPARDPARIIAETAVARVLHRLPGMRLAVHPDSLTWRPSPWSRALTALPVLFPQLPTAAEDRPGASAAPEVPEQEPPTADAPARTPGQGPARWHWWDTIG
ncbi:cytochrome P450 [Streptomyces sp. NPDC048623]|uniref:cytochrome P450 n=1 Tax=Streptomyces sp. NPDC048623 TaxID=3155761 RepID=UPI0034480314